MLIKHQKRQSVADKDKKKLISDFSINFTITNKFTSRSPHLFF